MENYIYWRISRHSENNGYIIHELLPSGKHNKSVAYSRTALSVKLTIVEDACLEGRVRTFRAKVDKELLDNKEDRHYYSVEELVQALKLESGEDDGF